MSITSFLFLGFVLLTLIIYYIIPPKAQWVILLIASIAFYVSFSFYGVFVMIATALFIWFAAVRIQKLKDESNAWLIDNKKTADKEERKAKKAYYQKKQKKYVILSIILSIGLLFLFKYYGKFALDINDALGTSFWTAENILIPLGVSYYSLMLIGYVTDVYRDLIYAEKNPLKVILFGSFFLSIMQGPFNRYGDLMPQICRDERPRLTFEKFRYAAIRITGGYIKKLCIADQVALIANEVFNNYTNYEGLGILLGIVCFAVQLYADFSGYMDIVIGIGELLGLELPENFKQPFFARSISEFWQKWHITLGLWLKDYVFYPILKSKAWKRMGKGITNKLGKEAGRRIPTYIGMLILWTLIGTWHGAGFNYIFSVGLLQFLYIFLGAICDPIFVKIKKLLRINDKKLYWHIWQAIRTTALMCFAWIFFRALSIGDALSMIKRVLVVPSLNQIGVMFDGNGGPLAGKTMIWLAFFGVCLTVLFLVDLLHNNRYSIRKWVFSKHYPIRLVFYLLLTFTILVFGAYGSQYVASSFIYFNF